MAGWGTGGGHWKGVNTSLRENRIGHGADADLKRGDLGPAKAFRGTVASWLSFNKIRAGHGYRVH